MANANLCADGEIKGYYEIIIQKRKNLSTKQYRCPYSPENFTCPKSIANNLFEALFFKVSLDNLTILIQETLRHSKIIYKQQVIQHDIKVKRFVQVQNMIIFYFIGMDQSMNMIAIFDFSTIQVSFLLLLSGCDICILVLDELQTKNYPYIL